MKIIPNARDYEAGTLPGLAVFFRKPGTGVQFHGDMHQLPGETVGDVVERFHGMFPRDVVCSVRDTSGRFLPFKPSKRMAAAMSAEYARFRKF